MWGNLRGRGKAYRKIWCKGAEEGAEEGTHPGRYHKAESVEEGERTQEIGKVELHNRRQLDHTHLPERQEGNTTFFHSGLCRAIALDGIM